MVDFSHLFTPMSSCSLFASKVGQPTDELLAAAIEAMSPPLLPAPDLSCLLLELDMTRRRQSGRPVGNIPRRVKLAKRIARIRRHDFPTYVRDALVARLESGRRFTELERGRPYHVAAVKRDRLAMIRRLYRQIYELLGQPPVLHPILGELPVPVGRPGMSRHLTAMVMRRQTLRERFGMNMPSIARMQNLVSENPHGKRE